MTNKDTTHVMSVAIKWQFGDLQPVAFSPMDTVAEEVIGHDDEPIEWFTHQSQEDLMELAPGLYMLELRIEMVNYMVHGLDGKPPRKVLYPHFELVDYSEQLTVGRKDYERIMFDVQRLHEESA